MIMAKERCKHSTYGLCAMCIDTNEGEGRLADESLWGQLFDDYADSEDDDYIPGLGYKHDDHAQYDGRSKERSEARWATIKHLVRSHL